jgi:hypothetical protein
VAAERIAENLAYINWTVLAALATGTLAAAVYGRLRTEATRGYLAFTAFCAFLLALMAFASDGALPVPGAGSPVLADPGLADLRHAALGLLCGLALAETVALARGRMARGLGLAAVASALAVLAIAAAAWGGSPAGAVAFAVWIAGLAGAAGGVLAAMILGHWYLVTPKLPEAPLVRFARILLGVVTAQVVLFLVFTGIGAGPSGAPAFAALTGAWALFVWLRLVVGLLFPLAVSWAAVQTARTRSMESATGLLYINVGTIAAGTILAAGLYFGAGILV